jgi:hypothetical protein
MWACAEVGPRVVTVPSKQKDTYEEFERAISPRPFFLLLLASCVPQCFAARLTTSNDER